MCDKSRNTWLCVHWQWNTLEWCQLNALQASPVVHLVTPLSCVSLSMNTQPSVPAIETDMQACAYACTHTRTHAYIHKYSCCFFWLRETAYNQQRSRQIVADPQSSDRGNIVSCQLSSTFDSRHRDCANKQSPKGGDNPSEMNMFNIGICTQCAMAQGNTETDKYTAFALTNLITTRRLQTGHVLILAVIRIARNRSTSGCAPPPSE